MTNPATDIKLYELAMENGRCASPYAWRIRYALAHKGLSFESVPLGFVGIQKTFDGRFKTIPVLEHDGTLMAESWGIAEFLDRQYPQRPLLFSSPAENAMVRLTDTWFAGEIMLKMFRMYVRDIHDAALPEDRSYFRESREKWLRGASLEAFTADRAAQLPVLRAALAPLRTHLKTRPFVGGSTPNYADYIVWGAFHWVASVATLPLLESSDPLRPYLDRGFDLNDGCGRDSRMKSLYE